MVSGATSPPLSPGRLSRKGKGTAVMLTGEYQHNMDLKGRVTVPSKFREDLGDKFYVCKGLDGCLFLLSQAQWDNLVEKVSAIPLAQGKAIQRLLLFRRRRGGAGQAGAHPHPPEPAGTRGAGKGCHRDRRGSAGRDLGHRPLERLQQNQTDEAIEAAMNLLDF